jgi:hypothetical protein
MNEQAQNQTPNALMPLDGFTDTDPSGSPLRGTTIRFKDGDYVSFSDKIETEGRTFAAYDLRSGWQKLERDVSPEYCMRKPGEPKPSQPHVDKADWPLNLNGQPENPWRWTFYLYLLDIASGEALTFWTNTIGGRIAIGALTDQVSLMRRHRANAIPVISLESCDMPTQYGGTKPRPHFGIRGWKVHGDEQQMLAHETPLVDVERPSLQEEMGGDEIPYNDPLPDLGARADQALQSAKAAPTKKKK